MAPLSETSTLTEEEKALYDRQIRLWGLAAQNRVRSAHVLLIGSKGCAAEVAKNLTLAGLGQITLMYGDLDRSERTVTSLDRCGNFLITAETTEVDRLSAMAPQLCDLNPTVSAIIDHDPIESKSDNFFNSFSVVIATECSLSMAQKLDDICRRNSTPFYWTAVHGLFTFFFCDHNGHKYVIK